jgi:hypothetical protein
MLMHILLWVPQEGLLMAFLAYGRLVLKPIA